MLDDAQVPAQSNFGWNTQRNVGDYEERLRCKTGKESSEAQPSERSFDPILKVFSRLIFWFHCRRKTQIQQGFLK